MHATLLPSCVLDFSLNVLLRISYTRRLLDAGEQVKGGRSVGLAALDSGSACRLGESWKSTPCLHLSVLSTFWNISQIIAAHLERTFLISQTRGMSQFSVSESLPAYRLNKDDLEGFLKELFPDHTTFKIQA